MAQLCEWLGWLGSAGGPQSSSTASGLVVLLTPSLLLGPAWLLLVAAIGGIAPPGRGPFAAASLAAAGIYASLTGTVYFLQLTLIVPRLTVGPGLGALDYLRFVPFRSPLYAVDVLGYSFMALSAGLAALALPRMGGARPASWALLAVAATAPFLVGQMIMPALIWPAASWGVSFPLACLLLCRLFLRKAA